MCSPASGPDLSFGGIQMARLGVLSIGPLIATFAVVNAQKPDGGAPPANAERKRADARLEATVFQLRVRPDRIADLDAKRLSGQASSASELQKALSAMGT